MSYGFIGMTDSHCAIATKQLIHLIGQYKAQIRANEIRPTDSVRLLHCIKTTPHGFLNLSFQSFKSFSEKYRKCSCCPFYSLTMIEF